VTIQQLGVDIGGSGVKGAPVDLDTAEFTAERERVETPQPSTPEAVADAVATVVGKFETEGCIGCTFPGIVQQGVIRSAANVDKGWIDTDAAALFGERLGRKVVVLNDADAAGIAEARFGAAKGRDGVVLVLTFGTGIGSALLNDGVLVPNTELGHVELDGHDAEDHASAAVREDKDLSWDDWGGRVDRYLQHLELLFTPDLFVIGGGVSKKFDKFAEFLHTRADIVPAELRNAAGIVGAALVAAGQAASPS
jgi:polyphosphate glucokinase